MPQRRKSDLSRYSRNATRKRNKRRNETTEEERAIAREERRVRMARLRASQSQEQSTAAREMARLAMKKRRANLRHQQLSKAQKSLKIDEKHESRCKQAAAETTAAIQHSEMYNTGELEMESGLGLVKENPQTSAKMETKEDTIEQCKSYTIIANVYRYLRMEYKWLKGQLGSQYDVSALSNIKERTAAAAGVAPGDVRRALHTQRRHAALRADHTYHRTGEEDKRDGVRFPDLKIISKSVKIKPSHKEQLPLDENDSEGLKPAKRRSISSSVRSKPSDDAQLPFPSPIQLRVLGAMETEYRTEPADDECPPTLGDDLLETMSPNHCRTAERTQMEVKTEPADCQENLIAHPFKLKMEDDEIGTLKLEIDVDGYQIDAVTKNNLPDIGPTSCQSPSRCKTAEGTQIEVKIEPADDDCQENLIANPLKHK